VLTAQAIAFFGDGFETSSTALGFAIFEIAMNSDVQEKLREEVDTVLENCDGKLSYEALQEMHYMDRVLAGKFIVFASTQFFNFLNRNTADVPTGHDHEQAVHQELPDAWF
jgi:hypothetical protein